MRFRFPLRHPKRVVTWSAALALWITVSYLSKILQTHDKILIRVKRFSILNDIDNDTDYTTTDNYEDVTWLTKQVVNGQSETSKDNNNNTILNKALDIKGSSQQGAMDKKGFVIDDKVEDSEVKSMVDCVVKKQRKNPNKARKKTKRETVSKRDGPKDKKKHQPVKEVICMDADAGTELETMADKGLETKETEFHQSRNKNFVQKVDDISSSVKDSSKKESGNKKANNEKDRVNNKLKKTGESNHNKTDSEIKIKILLKGQGKDSVKREKQKQKTHNTDKDIGARQFKTGNASKSLGGMDHANKPAKNGDKNSSKHLRNVVAGKSKQETLKTNMNSIVQGETTMGLPPKAHKSKFKAKSKVDEIRTESERNYIKDLFYLMKMLVI